MAMHHKRIVRCFEMADTCILQTHIKIAVFTGARIRVSFVKTVYLLEIGTEYPEIRAKYTLFLETQRFAKDIREPPSASELRQCLAQRLLEKRTHNFLARQSEIICGQCTPTFNHIVQILTRLDTASSHHHTLGSESCMVCHKIRMRDAVTVDEDKIIA